MSEPKSPSDSTPKSPSDSTPKSPSASTSSEPELLGQAAAGTPQSKKNLLFLVVIGAIIGSFFLLSAVEKPPHNMPPGETHTLRINSSRKLIALGSEKDIDVKFGIPIAQVKKMQGNKEQLKYKKRDVENRVNMYCARCHGRPGADPKTHPCGTLSGHCLPSTHSPKTECIKCHRQDFSKDKKQEKAPINLPLPDERLFEPHSAKPVLQKPLADRPRLERPALHKPLIDRPVTNRPSLQKPAANEKTAEKTPAPAKEGLNSADVQEKQDESR